MVAAAEQAWRAGAVPIASAEGFIRQVLGWREYVRGIYWSGETRMACMADAIAQTLTHGYAHHIQRLMVTGLYALLLGVHPKGVHQWYLAVYIERMSAGSLCARCPYRPAERIGENACPFTTLYWDFLLRHEQALAANPRTVMQVRNLARVNEDERARVRARAADVRTGQIA